MNDSRRKELSRIDDALARISYKLGDMCLLEHQASEKRTREGERSEVFNPWRHMVQARKDIVSAIDHLREATK